LDLDTFLVKIVVGVYMQQKTCTKMFGSCVVAIAFQSAFYLEMHENNIFLF
jgi:hypothetical protein